MSTTTALGTRPPTKRPSRARGQRAKRACLSCRVRKIRCDVTVHGIPCLNCKLDSEECIVKPRAGKRQSAKAVAEHLEEQQLQQQQQQQQLQQDLELGPSPVSSSLATSPPPDLLSRSSSGLADDGLCEPLLEAGGDGLDGFDGLCEKAVGGQGADILADCTMTAENALGTGQPPLLQSAAAPVSEPLHSFVPCICYRFIEADTAWRLAPADVAFLEQRSCFRLPEKTALGTFVTAYFRYVHPFLPVLNEAEFCAAYADQSVDLAPGQRTPLFVFQAMLFISCPYVPVSTLRALGFATTQQARTEFYSRAKALFDVDIYKDNVRSAQAALMLTYHAPTPNDKTSSFWLAIAVHYAQTVQAHRYHLATGATAAGSARQSVLKRLWWCCILRDRIMALGLRRPLHIQSAGFGSDLEHDSLNEGDFCDEIMHSEVYDRPTKQVMVQLIIALCELMGPLHSILTMIDPTNPANYCLGAGNGSSYSGNGNNNNNNNNNNGSHQPSLQELRRCLSRLDSWYQKAVARFQIPVHICGVDESLILFTKMIYIYYYTAKVLVCHHTIVRCVTDKDDPDAARELRLHAQSEINIARRKTTVDLMELLQRGLAQYLPNTFVAFSAFPFVWYILETKVAGSTISSSSSGSALAREQVSQPIQTYKAIMRGFREQHESADDVLLCIQSIVKHIQEAWPPQRTHERPREYASYLLQNSYQNALLDDVSSAAAAVADRPSPPQRPHDVWTDLLVGSPRRYCQILLTVDYFLSYGCFPSESDFPKVLQGLERDDPRDDSPGGSSSDMQVPGDFDFYQCLEQALEAALF